MNRARSTPRLARSGGCHRCTHRLPGGGGPRVHSLCSAARDGSCSVSLGGVRRANANALPNSVEQFSNDLSDLAKSPVVVSLPFHAQNMAWSSGGDEQSEG